MQQLKPVKHLRTVKSFVRREGRMTAKQHWAKKALWDRYGFPTGDQPICLTTLFGREAPVVLEIGFGDGSSLLQTAIANPDQNYLGIEVYETGAAKLMAAAHESHVSNLRIMIGDATQILEKQVVDHSLSVVQLFFPDPWPKTRHHKRRIVNTSFLSLVAKKLTVSGYFHCATDWQNYAEHMMKELEGHAKFTNQLGPSQYSPRPNSRPETKFERRGKKLGHGIWDLIYLHTP